MVVHDNHDMTIDQYITQWKIMELTTTYTNLFGKYEKHQLSTLIFIIVKFHQIRHSN
jgi:hypothetical protein